MVRLSPVQTLPVIEESTCRAIVRSLPHAVVLIDAGLHIVFANPAASVLFRVPAEKLSGQPITFFIPQHNLSQLLSDFGGKRTKVIEAPLPATPRGTSESTVRVVATRLLLKPRRVRRRAPIAAAVAPPAAAEYRLLVIENISDRAELEQQLVDSEKRAAMGQLAAGILHEVANPIASLGSNLLFVRSALDAMEIDDMKQALDISLDQLDQMRQLLGTLSGFPGRTAARYELADVHEVIRRCITFVANEAARRHIRLAISFAPTLITCEMDVRLIRQVLLNLLKNAMEAMPDGGRLQVRTRLRGEPSKPQVVLIHIADSGVGIADADLRKVFRPLFSTKPHGAGLGLSFCRQTVEEHGGQIRLSSRGMNHGTVATVSLPLRQDHGIGDD